MWTVTDQLNCPVEHGLTQVRLARRELKFKIENFLIVDQVCPLTVQPREREIVFFSFKRHGVFQIKAKTLTTR